MRENKNLGLVMSGGGTRGAYQMGVWQALYEMGLDQQIKVVTGASIGAINGALVVQQDWNLALELWKSIQPHEIFDSIEGEFSYRTLMRDWYQNGAIRVNSFKTLLKKHLDENIIRQSPIDFGFVVYNKTLRKGQSLFPEAIPEGLLIEYIIASATFPIFEAHRIGDYEYIDGGIHSILPTQIAFDRQHLDLVIAIDVTEASRFSIQQRNRHRQYAERLVYIRPSKMLPSPMNFTKEAFEKQLELGYKDGLKKLINFTEMARQ
ncbi:MAG: patatin-like phospholipase family protein [Saprospiraceae bacterium]|nr:patatin-like phospholipase family protein [Saprospiraceae bacterium]